MELTKDKIKKLKEEIAAKKGLGITSLAEERDLSLLEDAQREIDMWAEAQSILMDRAVWFKEADKLLKKILAIKQFHNQVDENGECIDKECTICAIIFCPFNEPLHYHHDGCPACFAEEIDKNKKENE